ncbi:hypothetical protein PoMZ_11494, partial [Pyricularia oryzae]
MPQPIPGLRRQFIALRHPPRDQPQVERLLLVQHPHALVRPVGAVGHELHVKVPDQPGQRQPRLHVRQPAAQAPARPDAKRLKDGLVVAGKHRHVLLLCLPFREPPLRPERPRLGKVARRVVRRPVRHLQRRARGQELAVDHGAARADLAVDARGQRRAHAQRLVDDGVEVRQLADGGVAHVRLLRKRAPDLAHQPAHRLGVAQQKVRGGRDEARRRLGSGNHHDLRVGVQLRQRQAVLVLALAGRLGVDGGVGQDLRHKVGPVRGAGDAPVDLVLGQGYVPLGLVHDALRNHHLDEHAEVAHGAHYLAVHHHVQPGHEVVDPGVEPVRREYQTTRQTSS